MNYQIHSQTLNTISSLQMNEFLLPTSISKTVLEEALVTQFSLHEDAPRTIQRNYRDTFDWRLYKKGFLFQVDKHSHSYELNLIPLDIGRRRVLTMQSQPTYIEDIPSKIWQQQLQGVLDIRALMSHITISLRQNTLRYVDKDGKTLSRIYIEEARLSQPNGRLKTLETRIRIVPITGYGKSSEQISKFLKKEFKLKAAKQVPFYPSAKALGLSVNNYNSQLSHPFSAKDRTDRALKALLLTLLDTMEVNEQGTVEDVDSEFLHDLRVSVRRTRSVLSQIKHIFPQRSLQRFEGGFSWVGQITGPTRDMHVYLLKFDNYQSALPKNMQPHLLPLKEFLIRHQKLEHEKLITVIKSNRYQVLKQSWRTFLTSPCPEKTSLENATKAISETADTHIWQAYSKLIKRGSAITASCPDEKLHKLRIVAKKLRYLLEFFQSLYPKSRIKSLISTLKKLQDVLGDFQDLSVQIDALKGFEIQMKEEGSLNPDTEAAIELLVQQLQSHIKAQRKLFETRFVEFSDKNMRSEFKLLFKKSPTKSQAVK